MGYENLKLEKGMYRQAGMNFTQVLESLDPSENYRGTALEGTDAFQRQLKRFGIRVKGAGSSTVEKFFATTDSAVLFPEYIARTVRQGVEENNILPSIVATTTRIEGMDYRSIFSTAGNAELKLETVEEGTAIPETAIKTRSRLVNLKKRGRMLVASYEALRFQRLDLFGIMLRQIGNYIQNQQMKDAISLLSDVSDEYNPTMCYSLGNEPISGTYGQLEYVNLVEFWNEFDPYTMNMMLCDSQAAVKVMKLPELQNPQTGINFAGTGKFGTPLGAQMVKTSYLPANTILGFDNRYALEHVCCGDVLVEYDKLIDRQLERAAITTISGFSKIFDDATKVLLV